MSLEVPLTESQLRDEIRGRLQDTSVGMKKKKSSAFNLQNFGMLPKSKILHLPILVNE